MKILIATLSSLTGTFFVIAAITASEPSLRILTLHPDSGPAYAESWAIDADSKGHLFVGGSVESPQGSSFVVKKSEDLGATWTIVDEYDGKDLNLKLAATYGLKVQGDKILMSGAGIDRQGVRHWITRLGRESGKSWSTIDDFQLVIGKPARSSGVGFGADGSFYAVGNAADAADLDHWIVRKMKPGGSTWQIVDDVSSQVKYLGGAGSKTTATDLLGTENATWVSGWWTPKPGDPMAYVVRKGDINGENWEFSDLTVEENKRGLAHELAENSKGEVFSAGFSADHCIVKKTIDQGRNWQIVDRFRDGKWSCGYAALEIFGDRIVAVGDNSAQGEQMRGFIRQSRDGGKTWTTYDTVVSSQGSAQVLAAVALSEKLFFVSGQIAVKEKFNKLAVWGLLE